MIFINKLTEPGQIKKLILRKENVEVHLVNGSIILYLAGNGHQEDKVIADNMRDYWRHINSGAEK